MPRAAQGDAGLAGENGAGTGSGGQRKADGVSVCARRRRVGETGRQQIVRAEAGRVGRTRPEEDATAIEFRETTTAKRNQQTAKSRSGGRSTFWSRRQGGAAEDVQMGREENRETMGAQQTYRTIPPPNFHSTAADCFCNRDGRQPEWETSGLLGIASSSSRLGGRQDLQIIEKTVRQRDERCLLTGRTPVCIFWMPAAVGSAADFGRRAF